MPDHQIILKAIDHIENNLQAPVTVSDMAEHVSYSLYHFCRVFNHFTHLTPYDYLIRRRLTSSIDMLLHSDRRILDIALEFQFNSPETYSRALRRMIGILPSKIRQSSQFDKRRLMPRWTDSHLEYIAENRANLHPIVVQLDPFQLVGMMTLVGEDDRVSSKVWEMFVKKYDTLGRRSSPSEIFAIKFHDEEWSQRDFVYMVGVDRENITEVPGPLVRMEFPAMQVVQFNHKGTLDQQRIALDYVYHAWIPRSSRELSLPWVIEIVNEGIWDARDEIHESCLCVPVV